ncbi:hypothetical protein FA014_12515 [Cellulomonas hominis]|uniref:SH3b domain-containing protein n=1 Tax=Cellulomonas hominis TaxID=156981 RepID=A0A7Z8JYD7_9CELL|nr:hypothetical protein [Cellulomonas hominis]TKR23200.1 hypothetical protein FA014_12515 [Cellulomonas hominis]
MKLRHRALGALTVSLVAAVGLAIPASSMTYAASGVAIRNSTSTSSTVLGRGYPGQVVQVYNNPVKVGGTYSYSVNGKSGTSDKWLLHDNLSTGVSGYSGLMFFN